MRLRRVLRQPGTHVVRLDDVDRGRRAVQADVGDGDLAGQLAPRMEQQAGFQGRERHGGIGAHRPRAGLAGEPVRARRDVDGQHGRVAGVRGVVLAVEAGAVGGIDHQRTGVEPIVGTETGGIEDAYAGAALPQPAGRVAAVVAVVPLARDDDHLAAVRAAHHRHGAPRHRRAGPSDQYLDRLGRVAIDCRHLVRRDDRNHCASATTNAMATASEWDNERCQRTMPRLSARTAALPRTTSAGSPESSSRVTSTSWNP